MFASLLNKIQKESNNLSDIDSELHDVIMSHVPKMSDSEVEACLVGYDYDQNEDAHLVLYERIENEILGEMVAA